MGFSLIHFLQMSFTKKISANALHTASRLKAALKAKGYRFLLDSPTNQIFVVLDNETLERLRREVVFSFWEKCDDSHTAIRFATSWATAMDDVDALIQLL